MITFKEFLREADTTHSVSEAVQVYLKNCTEWQDVDVPLHRYSEVKDDEPHTLRTREPRERLSASRGGTRPMQDFIFSQPGWEQYPPRSKSIFCSTTKDTALGDTNLMIYPFDGTKLAVVPEFDFNLMDVFRAVPANEREKFNHVSMGSLAGEIRSVYREFIQLANTEDSERPGVKGFIAQINEIKKHFMKDGEFDEDANGDEEMEEVYDNAWTRDRDMLRVIAKYVPEVFTPDKLEFKLTTPGTIDLPGKAREVWFSGKYLSIPSQYWHQFVEEVKAAK